MPDGVVHDVAHLDRWAVGPACQVGKPAPGTEQRRIAGEVRIRAFLAAGTDGKQDDVLARALQRFIAESQPVEHAGAEALGGDVGHRDDALGQGHAFGLLEVDPHRQLGRGNLIEGRRAHAAVDRMRLAEGVGAHGALDLHHFCAQLVQQVGAERPGVVHGEIGDADAGEWFHRAASRFISPSAGGPARSDSGAPSKWSGETSIGKAPTPSMATGWNSWRTASCGSRSTSAGV